MELLHLNGNQGRQPRTSINKCNGIENSLDSDSPLSTIIDVPKSLKSPSFIWQGARKLIFLDDFKVSPSFSVPLPEGCVSSGLTTSENFTCASCCALVSL